MPVIFRLWLVITGLIDINSLSESVICIVQHAAIIGKFRITVAVEITKEDVILGCVILPVFSVAVARVQACARGVEPPNLCVRILIAKLWETVMPVTGLADHHVGAPVVIYVVGYYCETTVVFFRIVIPQANIRRFDKVESSVAIVVRNPQAGFPDLL